MDEKDSCEVLKKNKDKLIDLLTIPLKEIKPIHEIRVKQFIPTDIIFVSNGAEIKYEIKDTVFYAFEINDVIKNLISEKNFNMHRIEDEIEPLNRIIIPGRILIKNNCVLPRTYLLEFGFLFYQVHLKRNNLLFSSNRDKFEIENIIFYCWDIDENKYLHGKLVSGKGFFSKKKMIKSLNTNKILVNCDFDWNSSLIISNDINLKIFAKKELDYNYLINKDLIRINFVSATLRVNEYFILANKEKLFRSILREEKITSEHIPMFITKNSKIFGEHYQYNNVWFALNSLRKNDDREWVDKREMITEPLFASFVVQSVI